MIEAPSTSRLINSLQAENKHQAARLERLWDALSWLQTYDAGSVDDIDGEFQISVSDRRVDKRIAPVRRGVVT